MNIFPLIKDPKNIVKTGKGVLVPIIWIASSIEVMWISSQREWEIGNRGVKYQKRKVVNVRCPSRFRRCVRHSVSLSPLKSSAALIET